MRTKVSVGPYGEVADLYEPSDTRRSLDDDAPVTGWMVFLALLGVVVGGTAAGIATSLLSISTGMSEFSKGLFLLLWLMFAVIFFAWGMHVRERIRSVGRMRSDMRAELKKREDPFYNPPKFPGQQGTWTSRSAEAPLDPANTTSNPGRQRE